MNNLSQLEIFQTACFTGHRTERLPKNSDEMLRMQSRLSEAIEAAISRGIVNFISGAMPGLVRWQPSRF